VYASDWLEVPDAAIPQSQPVMTVIGGEVVWQATEGTVPFASERAVP
jgi:hypothetical protein